jgi:hypothetical protein
MIVGKGINITNDKMIASSKHSVGGKMDIHMQDSGIELFTYIKMNLNYIKHLNKTIKLGE